LARNQATISKGIDMIKFPLKISSFARKNATPLSSCAPFVDNSRAQLIHRPREVSLFKASWGRHTSVHYWCGNCSSGENIFTFIDSYDGPKLLCQRCEDNAVKAGLPSADSLIGKHIHQGKLVPVQTCCQNKDN